MSQNKRVIRRWSNEENILILEYLINTLRSGCLVEKPSAAIYYRNLIEATQLQNCNENLIKNKVRNFQTSYVESLNWQKQTGQQIKESNGELTFQTVLKKRYPYLHLMEEIWGHRNNTQSSYSSDAEQFESSVEGEFVSASRLIAPDLESTFFSEDNIKTEIEDIDVSNATSGSSNMIVDVSMFGKNECSPAKRPNTELIDQNAHSPERTGNKRLKMQLDKLEWDRKRFEDSLAFEREKLEFEKFKFIENLKDQHQKWMAENELRKKELEVKEVEIQANKEIKLKEFQLEMLKRSPM